MIFGSIAERAFEEQERIERAKEYLTDPVGWARDFLGVYLWSKQAEVAMSLVTDKNVVVKAGHEVGKSFLAGLLICWWVDVHWQLPGGCFVVSTAPSTKQINAIVWREVRRFFNVAEERYKNGLVDHKLPGYITSDAHWRLPDGIELGYGAKPPDAKSDTMSGIHARYVLSVGDEAVGLSEELIGDLGNITSNATSRRFLICNPTNPLSYVAKIFKRQTGTWRTHSISVLDSPNFHEGGEGLPVEILETLVDQSYVDDMARDYGVTSPTYISRVLGEFAWDMGFTLIRPEDVAVGLDCEIEPSLETLPRLGVDFSRSKAGDKNSVYSWHDGKLRYVDSWNEPNALRTAEKVDGYARQFGVREVRVDGSGLGGPIADYLRRIAEGHYLVIEMLGGASSPDRSRWFNARAYWYWHFQDRLSRGEIDVDETDDVLQQELQGIEIKKRISGVDNLLIESKEDMRKRGVGSPDHADAAIYASADLEWLTEDPMAGAKQGERVGFDPEYFLEEEDFAAMPW